LVELKIIINYLNALGYSVILEESSKLFIFRMNYDDCESCGG